MIKILRIIYDRDTTLYSCLVSNLEYQTIPSTCNLSSNKLIVTFVTINSYYLYKLFSNCKTLTFVISFLYTDVFNLVHLLFITPVSFKFLFRNSWVTDMNSHDLRTIPLINSFIRVWDDLMTVRSAHTKHHKSHIFQVVSLSHIFPLTYPLYISYKKGSWKPFTRIGKGRSKVVVKHKTFND